VHSVRAVKRAVHPRPFNTPDGGRRSTHPWPSHEAQLDADAQSQSRANTAFEACTSHPVEAWKRGGRLLRNAHGGRGTTALESGSISADVHSLLWNRVPGGPVEAGTRAPANDTPRTAAASPDRATGSISGDFHVVLWSRVLCWKWEHIVAVRFRRRSIRVGLPGLG
jgi:hypothetical protein